MEKQNDKKKLLKDSDEIEYILEYKIEGEHIHFKIIENKVYAPFTFEGSFTLEDFIERSSAFKSCDNLEDIIYHINNLYSQNKITLNNLGPLKERYLSFILKNISEEVQTNDFTLYLKMIENKDKALADLYNIQSGHIELFKKIKLLIEKNLAKENPLLKSINNIFEESESKILIN